VTQDGPHFAAKDAHVAYARLGDCALNKSLTIVLPVHNGESKLRSCVREVLEVASDMTSAFGILIVDDGSTDATFEVAAELSARYPQVSVRRHRYHRGLGPTIEYVQRHVRSDAVMLHDGVTPIDANQMRNEWRRWMARSQNGGGSDHVMLQSDICDFANLPAIHATMERTHGRMLGFQLVAPAPLDDVSPRENYAEARGQRTADSTTRQRPDLGRIPPLPRPKFLQAIAQFAFGE
jgi:Glycosyl transferase family 2